ncbi:hypothetical protein OROMI_033229 [Orobanche minor]
MGTTELLAEQPTLEELFDLKSDMEKLSEERHADELPEEQQKLPEVNTRQVVVHSASPEANISSDMQDLIIRTVAEEIAKALSQFVKPELAELKKDLKEQLAPLSSMQEQISTLLNRRYPSPAPQPSRMPFGLADLMNKVEEQLVRFAYGKKGEERKEEGNVESNFVFSFPKNTTWIHLRSSPINPNFGVHVNKNNVALIIFGDGSVKLKLKL